MMGILPRALAWELGLLVLVAVGVAKLPEVGFFSVLVGLFLSCLFLSSLTFFSSSSFFSAAEFTLEDGSVVKSSSWLLVSLLSIPFIIFVAD